MIAEYCMDRWNLMEWQQIYTNISSLISCTCWYSTGRDDNRIKAELLQKELDELQQKVCCRLLCYIFFRNESIKYTAYCVHNVRHINQRVVIVSAMGGSCTITSCVGGRHNMPPPPCKLTFNLLTLKVVSYLFHDLDPMYATDRDIRRASSLNCSVLWWWGHNKYDSLWLCK